MYIKTLLIVQHKHGMKMRLIWLERLNGIICLGCINVHRWNGWLTSSNWATHSGKWGLRWKPKTIAVALS